MKDGAVVQTGTPEELVTSPADGYVAEFTKAVPRAKVVKVESLMGPVAEALGRIDGADVPASARVAEAAPLFGDAGSMRVVGPDGVAVGVLRRADVVALMMAG